MTPAKPTLELLRSLTDQHVLGALMAEPRLTRAEIAVRTDISKPTVGESVRRLTEAGLLRDTGERTTGRGRVGTYYALAEDLGAALVVSIAPEGVVAEVVDVYGEVVAREVREVEPVGVTRVVQEVGTRAAAASPGPLRLAVVSAADPVDRSTGRLVHLPDAPFLVGDLAPAEALAAVVAGAVTVDNDVNWAARAERAAAEAALDDFVYLYLGEGLGCAVVSDGEVRRGARGLTGEIAHVLTRGPDGRAMPFTEVFAELGLRQRGSTAIDVPALIDAIDTAAIRSQLADAVCGVLAAAVALADPEVVVVGGTWGPAVADAVAERFTGLPRYVDLRPTAVTHEAPLAGARRQAIQDLRETVLAAPTG